MEKRIIHLETLSALQDETIRQLNEEVFRQQRDMAQLRTRIELLENKLRELAEGQEIAGNERPPHY